MTILHVIEGGSVEQSTGCKAFTVAEVAALIGVPYQSVRRLVRDGSLRALRVDGLVRVPAAALDEFLAGQ